MFNLDPNQQKNTVEADDENVSANMNIEQRTDYSGLDASKLDNQIGDGDENGGRGVVSDRSFSGKNGLKTIAFASVGLLATLFIVFGIFSMVSNSDKKTKNTDNVREVTAEIENSKPHEFKDSELPPPPIVDKPEENDEKQEEVSLSGLMIAPESNNQIEPQPDLTLERKLSGSVLLIDNDINQASNQGQDAFLVSEEPSSDSLSFAGSTFTPTFAKRRADKTHLLARGTTIPCVLVTKIVTDHAGLTKCQATKDVWSADGKTVLAERGTIFMGEQRAAMLQGQARVAVIWTHLETPKGVVVNIDSPSVGKLGAAGNSAWVNYHFWHRFGGAVMLSLIGDFGKGISNKMSRKQSDITFEETAENAEEMATEALRNSINIPPTGTINQGALLNIMVARDVDFRNVYERVGLLNLTVP